jgi:hypothetical protein
MKLSGRFYGVAVLGMSLAASGQTCTTQARMQSSMRMPMVDTALMLGSAVKSDDTNAVKTASVVEYANNFAPVENVIQNTSDKLRGDTLRVTHVYLLDTSTEKADGVNELDVTCPLEGTTSEVDFSIPGLGPGVYGFAMVEAAGGDRPWLLSFLLQRQGSSWKMEGFYPHARTAAGKDGLWYWTDARKKAAAKEPWLAWLEYSESERLLSPAGFVSTTNLNRLRAEQRMAAPPELADGMSVDAPLVIRGVGGQEFRFTSIAPESASDGASLHLVLHYAAEALPAAEADRVRNLASAEAMLLAHPELRQGFSGVIVFADVPGQNPSALSVPMEEIPKG